MREIEELKVDIKKYIFSAIAHTIGIGPAAMEKLPSALQRRALVFSTEAGSLKLILCLIAMTGGKNLSSHGINPLIDGGITLIDLKGICPNNIILGMNKELIVSTSPKRCHSIYQNGGNSYYLFSPLVSSPS